MITVIQKLDAFSYLQIATIIMLVPTTTVTKLLVANTQDTLVTIMMNALTILAMSKAGVNMLK